MKTILETIVEHKHIEVLKRKGRKTLKELESMRHFDRQPVDPVASLKAEGPSFIAEFKRRSPSKGIINTGHTVGFVTKGYASAGAAACSILTDRDFFGGSFRDLESARDAVPGTPLLRKDFIIDPYQVVEAKAYGADIILLIAAILEPAQVRELTREAVSLGIQVLLEVHSAEEVESWHPDIRLVGVNNRDLRTFRVDIKNSLELADALPAEVVKISESGLGDPGDILQLRSAGYDGFLLGEHFMKSEDPGRALQQLIKTLKN